MVACLDQRPFFWRTGTSYRFHTGARADAANIGRPRAPPSHDAGFFALLLVILIVVYFAAFVAPAAAGDAPASGAATVVTTAHRPEFEPAREAPLGNELGAVLPLPAMFGLGAPRRGPMWREMSAGADVSARSWLVYGGATISPFGDLWTDGWRLRATTGYGAYSYIGNRFDPSTGTAARFAFAGRITFVDGLAGYLWRLGPLTAKAFAGVSMIDHEIAPLDYLASAGMRVGAKGVVELWLNLGQLAWTSLDASYSTAHRTYSARSRIGYRIMSTLTVGVEAGINGSAGFDEDGGKTAMLDPQHRDLRFGGFARLEWCGGELSLSAGMSTDLAERRDVYGTVGYLYQF